MIDYIILDQKRIEEYKKTFSENLIIKVLLSRREVIIDRDQKRKDWRAGKKFVSKLYVEHNYDVDFLQDCWHAS